MNSALATGEFRQITKRGDIKRMGEDENRWYPPHPNHTYLYHDRNGQIVYVGDEVLKIDKDNRTIDFQLCQNCLEPFADWKDTCPHCRYNLNENIRIQEENKLRTLQNIRNLFYWYRTHPEAL